MLVKLDPSGAEKYTEYGYALALDKTRSAYPTYTDGIKTERDFAAALVELASGNNSELLLLERDGKACGLFGYFFIPEDKYVQLTVMNVETDAYAALSEFTGYLRKSFCGYELYIGVPYENAVARSFLAENGFERIEESYHYTLDFERYTPRGGHKCVRAVSAENFCDFRALHDGVEMYWSSERILETLSDWQAFVYYADGAPTATIYARGKKSPEIFGADFANGFDSSAYKSLLSALLDSAKEFGARHIIYFAEDREREAAEAAGFCAIGKYICFKTNL